MSLQDIFSTSGTSSISCVFRDASGGTAYTAEQQKFTSNLQNPNAQGYLLEYAQTAYSTSIGGSNGATGSREACSNLLMKDIVALFTTDPDPITIDTKKIYTVPTAARDLITFDKSQGIFKGYQLTNVVIINKYTTSYLGPTSIPVTDSSYTLGPTHCLSYITNSASWGQASVFGDIEYTVDYLAANPRGAKQSYTAEGSGVGFLETFDNCRQALNEKENSFPINTTNLKPGEPICSSTNTYYINCPYTLSAPTNGGWYSTKTEEFYMAVLFTDENGETYCVTSQNEPYDETIQNWLDTSKNVFNFTVIYDFIGTWCSAITGFSSQPTNGPPGPTSWPTNGSINQSSYFNIGTFFDNTGVFFDPQPGQKYSWFDATIENWKTTVQDLFGVKLNLSSTYIGTQYLTNIVDKLEYTAVPLNSAQINATFYPQATPPTGNWTCTATASMSDFTTGTEITQTTSASQSGNSIGQSNIRANVALFQNLQSTGLKNTTNLQIGQNVCAIKTTFKTTQT
jgi:hypothetical protein